jgi:hypothetical protein
MGQILEWREVVDKVFDKEMIMENIVSEEKVCGIGNVVDSSNPKTVSLKKQTQNELAIKVINELPNWDFLWSSFNSFVRDNGLEKPMNLMIWNMSWMSQSVPYKWETMVRVTNHMISLVMDKGWYDSYGIVSTQRNGVLTHNGSGTLLDWAGREYRVESVEFLALTKILLCNYLEIQLSEEQYEIQSEFHYSDGKFVSILN